MDDLTDRAATSQAEVPQLDSPDNTEGTNGPIVNDLISLQKQLKDKRAEVTPEFITSATRDQLEAKKLEAKTLWDLYSSKIAELDENTLSTTSKANLPAHKKAAQEAFEQIEQIYNSSKFNVASEKAKILTKAYEHLKDEKEKVTIEYLHHSTTEELEKERSLHSDWYIDFQTVLRQIVLDDLSQTERDELIKQKVWVETAAPNVDTYLLHEINAREAKKEQPKHPETNDSDDPKLGSTQQNNDDTDLEDIQNLRDAIAKLESQNQKDLKEAEEKIQSLETKLQLAQFNQELPSELYEYHPDVMPGDGEETAPSDTISGVKIEAMEIPTFSGKLDDWQNFRDMFEALINKSRKMDKIVKFNYLRTHLTGIALETIKGYPVTGGNYDGAWADLKKRFNKTDEIVDEYIRKVFEIKPIEHKVNYFTLIGIIDTTNQMLRALPSLGVRVSGWDPVINFIICTKLNEELRWEWYQKKNRDELKETTDLLNHLEFKASQLQPKQGDKHSKSTKTEGNQRSSHKKVFQTNESKTSQKEKPKKECLICKGNHHTWDCNILAKETAKVRTSIAKAFGLCFKCLLKHRAGLCENEDCEYCGGQHHILLCFSKESAKRQKQQRSADQGQQSNQLKKWQPQPSTSKETHGNEGNGWNQSMTKKNPDS